MPHVVRMSADRALPPLRVEERVSVRARRIRVELRAEGVVRLVIPRGTSREAARAFLASRSGWVERSWQRMAARAVRPRSLLWDGSDYLPLHGQAMPVRRVDSSLNRVLVRIDGQIEVFAPSTATTPELDRGLCSELHRLARQDARQMLAQEAARMGVSFLGPRIGDQRSLWGSCAASGLISLSWRLVLASPDVMRYVIVHELCHRIHANHSRQFWRLVARQQPDYQSARRWLKTHGAELHAILPAR